MNQNFSSVLAQVSPNFTYNNNNHIENPVTFNLAKRVETSMDFAANRSPGVANRLRSLKQSHQRTVSVGVEVRSAPQ